MSFFNITQFGWQNYKNEAFGIITLALPMFIAQIAQVGTGFVDTVMAGHLGQADLAAVGVGSNIFITVYVTFLGIATSLNPILSQQFGSGAKLELGETVRQGLWFCFGLGIVGMISLLLLTIPLHTHLSMSEYTRDTTILFVIGTSLAMPAAMLHRALHAYASSLNKSTPIMIVSLLALSLNVPFNYILMHGLFGLPKLGGAGCGFGTALAFWVNFLALFIYLSKSQYFKPFGLMQRFSWPNWQRMKEFIKLGLPIGLSFFLEVSLFSFIALLIVQFGEVYIATQQAVINVTSIIYMLPQTTSAALSVRVAQAIGARSYARARHISGVGITMGMVVAICTASLVLLFRESIISIYTNDPQIIKVGATLLIFAAFFQLSDAIQTIASGALRGYKLTKVAMIIHAISFWGFGLGVGCYLGLVLQMGLYGFWTALNISLFVAAILLVSYLLNRSKAFLVRDHY
ncbi:MATE family efflux transporter [Neisseria sp. Ec49-e6-T10]|uniref:MATE family efflux transporter n=1 Tax=Neisseria sp. Ec49-e6-T10 TaxID=3140744 RepID=UPI003EB8E592